MLKVVCDFYHDTVHVAKMQDQVEYQKTKTNIDIVCNILSHH